MRVTSFRRRSGAGRAGSVLLGIALILAGCSDDVLRPVDVPDPARAGEGLRPTPNEKVALAEGTSAGVMRVMVEPARLDLRLDEVAVLEAVPLDAGGMPVEAPVVWWSADPDRVMVSPTGAVLAKAVGRTEVRAYSGATYTAMQVGVIPWDGPIGSVEATAASIEIVPGPMDVMVGGYMQLLWRIYDADGALIVRKAEWSSSDPSRAIVSETGTVIGLAPGPVTITATSDGVSASVEINVYERRPPELFGLAIQPADTTIYIGDTLLLTVTMWDVNHMPVVYSITWGCSPHQVASVGDGQVKGLGIGEAMISATAGGKTAYAHVVVKPKDGGLEENVIRIEVDPWRSIHDVGEQVQMSARTYVAHAVDIGAPVDWSILSGPGTIDENGLVSLTDKGVVIVEARIGEVFGLATIWVGPILRIEIDPWRSEHQVGDEVHMSARTYVAHAVDIGAPVTWSVLSGPATINQKGVLHVTGSGLIVVEARIGEVVGLAEITVAAPN